MPRASTKAIAILVSLLVFLSVVPFPVINGSVSVTYLIESSKSDASTTSGAANWNDASYYIAKSDVIAGCRWQVNIPKGSTIEQAVVKVRAKSTALSAPKCRIQIFDQDSCAAFDSVFWDWAVVPQPVNWDLPLFVAGTWYDSPDLKNIVQAYVNRLGYQSGAFLGIRFEYQSGLQLQPPEAWALDGDSASAAKLEVTYTPPPPGPPKPPVASFSHEPLSPTVNGTVTFDATASYSLSGSITEYSWNFGDGTPQVIEADPITYHSYAAAGTFTVTLTVTDSNSLMNSTSREIIVSEPVQSPPVADFSFLPEHPLFSETVAFDGSASYDVDGSIVNYSWDFGDGTSGMGLTVEHSFNSFGAYLVTLLVTDNNGNTGQKSEYILVVKNPIASFAYAPAYPVVSELVSFDASGSAPEGGVISTFNWDFGDGGSKTETDPTTTHAFAAAGNYSVTLTVTDSEGLSDTTSRSITVVPSAPVQHPPIADFLFWPERPLFNGTVTFNASASYDSDGSIVSFSWDFGDGTFGTGIIVSHSFLSHGAHLVTLLVTDNDALTGQTGKYVSVIKSPIASFVCTPAYPVAGQLVTFDASSSAPEGGSISVFSWNFGDGNLKNETNPITSHAFGLLGSYIVTLTVTDSEGLSDTISRNVTVVATPVSPPIASFTISPNAMANATVIFNANSSYDADGYIVDYLWDFGDGNQIHVTTAVVGHAYLLPGNYSVTLTVKDDDDISNSTTVQVTVSAFPIVAFTFSPSSPVIGEFVAFDASQSVANSQGISLYIWNFGDGNITSVTTPFIVHRYQMYGSYQMTLNITNTDGLHDIESKPAIIYAKPVASFTFSPNSQVTSQGILFDAQLCLDPDGTITSYSWNFGDGNITLTYTPTVYHAYANYGNYVVVLTILDNDGHTDSTSRSLQVAESQMPPVNPPEEDVHDVSVQSIHVSQTSVQIGQAVNITVTAKNQGTLPESFNITIHYGMTEIGKQEVLNLNPNASITLTFWWNTTGFSAGTSRTRAAADAVTHEADLSDNAIEGENIELLSSNSPNADSPDPDETGSPQPNFSATIPYIVVAAVAVTCPILFLTLKRKKNGSGKANFSYLDKMLGGGIPAGSTILVLGNPGAGKSILCQHLAHRFLDEGKACVFVSYDEPPGDVRKRMESFGWDLAKFEQSNAFSFVDCYSQVAKVASPEKHYVDQPFSLTDLSITISTAMDEVKNDNSKAVFLDSATSLFTKLEIQRVIRFLQDRSAKIKASGGIFIFTLGKETIAANFANRLEEAVDGIIELDFLDVQGKRTRKLRVKKLRGQHRDQWTAFTINSNEGIVFHPHTRA